MAIIVIKSYHCKDQQPRFVWRRNCRFCYTIEENVWRVVLENGVNRLTSLNHFMKVSNKGRLEVADNQHKFELVNRWLASQRSSKHHWLIQWCTQMSRQQITNIFNLNWNLKLPFAKFPKVLTWFQEIIETQNFSICFRKIFAYGKDLKTVCRSEMRALGALLSFIGQLGVSFECLCYSFVLRFRLWFINYFCKLCTIFFKVTLVLRKFSICVTMDDESLLLPGSLLIFSCQTMTLNSI